MTIRITHFSDALCIWAYISQIRVAELRDNFGDEVVFDYRYFNVFGDVAKKMATQWRDKGGLSGYAAHVRETAANFAHVRIDDNLWKHNTPASSMPAHLVLSAAKVLTGDDNRSLLALDHEIRRSFFEDGVNISNSTALLEICERQGMPVASIEIALENGTAHASLSDDMKQAQEIGIRSSPTMRFNDGRQTLTGNVGYRVIEANIRELIAGPQDQQSWC